MRFYIELVLIMGWLIDYDERTIIFKIWPTNSMCVCVSVMWSEKPHPFHLSHTFRMDQFDTCDTLRVNMKHTHTCSCAFDLKIHKNTEEQSKTVHKYNGSCWQKYKLNTIRFFLHVFRATFDDLICNMMLSSINFTRLRAG